MRAEDRELRSEDRGIKGAGSSAVNECQRALPHFALGSLLTLCAMRFAPSELTSACVCG